MSPASRRVARIITWVFLIVAALFWILTMIGWFISDPGFEPAIVVASVIFSALGGISRWLGKEPDKTAKQMNFAVGSSSVSLSAGGIECVNGEFSMRSELTVGFHARICTHNPGLPASVKLVIHSMEPHSLSDCLPNGLSLQDIGIVVEYKKHPDWASIELGNPFSAISGDRNFDVSAKIPFGVDRVEHNYDSVASLKEAIITLRADFEPLDHHLLIGPIRFDMTPVHRSIEKCVISKIPKYQLGSTQAHDTEKLVQTLKRYWLGRDEGKQ